ncbi:sulfur carrier protein ThiS [Flectobacillus longus]|jgi:sulfur carrier protein|uniref:sulfur carrier protein ThiS n=1 Tax=Flectobacillus longus TaxID=2984207 RepID=UPI0024B77DB3|nr:sulfur carrier protein ThiS [Flectobacillus longus]MDI9879971.1 sulfur carrier protein ThiS [Flectobacillus longus]
MTVFINSEATEVASNFKVEDLLQQFYLAQVKGLAIAVNDMVLPKSEWQSYVFAENDQVTLIRASQGG